MIHQMDWVVNLTEGCGGPDLERMHLCFLVLINICTVTEALFTFHSLFRDCFTWQAILLRINCAGMHL